MPSLIRRAPLTSLTPLLVLCAGACLPLTCVNAARAEGAFTHVQPPQADRRPADAADALPIRRITLYRSGVGAFEREGAVADNAKVQLKFDVSQINDILKSLQLLDLDGGRIDSVSYPSKDPLAKRLGAFSVPIADSPSIPVLLGRLRGSVIDIRTPGESIKGTILSVETRKVPGGKDEPSIDMPYVNLLTPAGITSVPIGAIMSFKLDDPQLADELTKALAAVADARADRIKTIDLSLRGEGSRRVVARYVHETPVWKTSYRLIMSDASEQKQGGAGGKAVPGTFSLQGWAIVENTTDMDWKDVKLSLVSGRPVSFIMDLSEPLYLARPTLPVPTIPGVMPRTFEGGVNVANGLKDESFEKRKISTTSGARELASSAAESAGQSRANKQMMMLADLPAGVTADGLLKYSPASQAKAGEIGEVFFYEVQNPITIERQRSAMIPFLTANMDGRRVSIYNLADRPDHPMRGVEIKNTSDLQLLPGPLAVFDGSAYAGDATINQVSPGDKRLLAYALDLDVAVTTNPGNSGEVTKVRLVDGMLEQTVRQVDAMSYTFANKDQKRSRTIIVEHPRLPEWELKEPAKAIEQTQNLYRFEVAAEPGKQVNLTVRQERVSSQRMDVTSYDMPTILRWKQEGKLSKAVVDAIQKLASLQAVVAESQRQVNELQKQVATNTAEQTRISETMQRLPQNSEVYSDYMKELKELNTALKSLRQRHQEKLQETEAKMRERDDYVRGLNVE